MEIYIYLWGKHGENSIVKQLENIYFGSICVNIVFPTKDFQREKKYKRGTNPQKNSPPRIKDPHRRLFGRRNNVQPPFKEK